MTQQTIEQSLIPTPPQDVVVTVDGEEIRVKVSFKGYDREGLAIWKCLGLTPERIEKVAIGLFPGRCTLEF